MLLRALPVSFVPPSLPLSLFSLPVFCVVQVCFELGMHYRLPRTDPPVLVSQVLELPERMPMPCQP